MPTCAGAGMTAREAYVHVCGLLQDAGVPDAAFDADALIAHVAGASRFILDDLTASQTADLLALAARRARREPLQYILGSWSFLDLELAVGPGVLVPRPETEEVCLAAAGLLEGQEAPAILDLCSGSGALALGLQSRLPKAQVTAVEQSPEAFAYLLRNIEAFAQRRPRAPRAVLADAFAYHGQLPRQSLDLLVCNPPYVTAEEYGQLAPEVLAEPRVALVAAQEGLAFYRAISANYRLALRPGGWLVFEIGAGQGAAVCGILAQDGYGDIGLRQDMAGHNRIVLAKKR